MDDDGCTDVHGRAGDAHGTRTGRAGDVHARRDATSEENLWKNRSEKCIQSSAFLEALSMLSRGSRSLLEAFSRPSPRLFLGTRYPCPSPSPVFRPGKTGKGSLAGGRKRLRVCHSSSGPPPLTRAVTRGSSLLARHSWLVTRGSSLGSKRCGCRYLHSKAIRRIE